MKTFLTAAGAVCAVHCMTLTAAFANGNGSTNGGGWGNGNGGGFNNGVGNPHGVPEIDAGAGLLALAAVGAALVLAWEADRRSRA
ncbi:VPEID-CTERM sorting domain-containing protein [Leisingera sp. S132]|uniref:VPEID-CTERM sorting domain-containing protein n=1 Tax=Leisingera sp. S132 TaxID=2867016 RepID=UPI0021A65DB4|nr:VPEID-CTERM sorting domain-containing protein [Leisingera sp. S132]UWQ79239.1 VPEID-CTERM sorting domain-containing protein [Leisingera sp. S132]